MDCVLCVHFSRPFGTEAEVTHPVAHCSISVLASKEQQNKEELSRQERDSDRGWKSAPCSQSPPWRYMSGHCLKPSE